MEKEKAMEFMNAMEMIVIIGVNDGINNNGVIALNNLGNNLSKVEKACYL